jgi:hypothetical protein
MSHDRKSGRPQASLAANRSSLIIFQHHNRPNIVVHQRERFRCAGDEMSALWLKVVARPEPAHSTSGALLTTPNKQSLDARQGQIPEMSH